MTEHKNIPIPDDKKPQESSLLERASGAFGFDPFSAAPIKGKLPEAPMKRAKVREKSRKNDAPTQARAPEVQKPLPEVQIDQRRDGGIEETFSMRAAEPVHQSAANLPVPVEHREIVIHEEETAVELSGKSYKVDRESLREKGLIVPGGAVSALFEEFRIVKRQLLDVARKSNNPLFRRILICSPHPAEGKTFCAINLAIAAAAERDSEVVLVDADLAKPSILSTLGLPRGPGLMDCLADESLKPEKLMIGTDIPGLWVLPSGSQTSADSEYLASNQTGELLDRLTFGAPNRILIFDTPPALAASPAAELAKHVGQAVLVARADKTDRNALEDACQLLSACPDIKLLLNAALYSPSGRNFGSYYGYEE